ncbi:Hypothetical protein CB129slpB_1758 [Propionibacterium freudenreichii]|nr:Hypothetical protein CB129slpB_1758 [Propionibacterium freudenreichii]
MGRWCPQRPQGARPRDGCGVGRCVGCGHCVRFGHHAEPALHRRHGLHQLHVVDRHRPAPGASHLVRAALRCPAARRVPWFRDDHGGGPCAHLPAVPAGDPVPLQPRILGRRGAVERRAGGSHRRRPGWLRDRTHPRRAGQYRRPAVAGCRCRLGSRRQGP